MSSHGNQESQLGQEPEAQTHSRVSRKGPGSGVSRAPSIRSDVSKDDPPLMTEGERVSRMGTGSCVSRAPSMKSDWSKDDPPLMTEGKRVSRKAAGSGVSRALSMKSDVSKDDPPLMREGESRVSRKVAGSGVSRAPSMMSDVSKDDGPDMAEGEREQEEGYEPDTSSSQDKQPDLPHIFEVLEKKMVTFLKTELQRFKQILSPDYKENFEMKSEDETDAREGALKLALHFLCKMEHQDLADKLNDNELYVICQNGLKQNLKNKYQNVFEGIAKHGSSVLLEKIYTDLYITEGGGGKVNKEHEVRQIESRSKRSTGQDKPIKCADIFKPSSGQDKPIRRVLTKGVAGIGKTISVHKYILDWVEGKDNQEINFIFPLCFRELNLMRDKEWYLMDLLHHFFPETKQLRLGSQKKYNVLFVFDGLDECRLQLNFQTNESLTNEKVITSLDVLLTNLLKGNLFPSALIWITSRPAAACQIPPECVDLVTEVQGFNNSQKEEYFRKRINNESLASEIISHIKSSRSLHIMCHIPVFCWIAAMVLEMIYSSGQTEIPKTLTEMYTYFFVFQIRQRNIKFHNVHDINMQRSHELILRLGKLAYEQLEKGNLIFYEEDLRNCGIDVKEATIFSGMCTQIFREESGIFLGTVFCFVHLSIQEYLAALYALLMMGVEKKNIISTPHSIPMMKPTITFHKSAVDKALTYEDGRFDLFLRFLLGLSLESNQTLLHGLIQMRQIQTSNDETIAYIKEKIREVSSSERMVNLFHCLNELDDNSLVEEIKSFLRAGTISESKLSPGQWSALVFMLLTSDQNLDVFDLKTYIRSDEALLRLQPVVEESHTTLVNNCELTEQSCITLATILRKESSKLRHLYISDNHIGDDGVKELCMGLKSTNCTLETLSLSDCGVTGEGYTALASALQSNPSHLEELYLRGNDPGDSGVKLLTDLLKDPQCKLKGLRLLKTDAAERACEYLTLVLGGNPLLLTELDLSGKIPGDSGLKQLCALLEDSHCRIKTLRISSCGLTEQSCATLASVLRKESLKLRHLDLSDNPIGDDGVLLLCSGLKSPNCALETLSLSDCDVTGEGYAALASALKSNLEELDLRGNDPGDAGVKLLTNLLQDPQCKLKRLRLLKSDTAEEACEYLTSLVHDNPLLLTELDLRGKISEHSEVKHCCALLEDSHCKWQKLRLELCSITEEGCAALTSALTSNPSSQLTYLELDHNKLGDSGVKHIAALLRNPDCKLTVLWLNDCSITADGCTALTSALTSNQESRLTCLGLSSNKLGDLGVKQISALLRNPECKLRWLWLCDCRITDEGCAALNSALKSNPLSHLINLYISK